MADLLLFDGDCGYCRRWVDWSLARGAPVEFAPCQDRGSRHGLTLEDCHKAAWFIGEPRRRGARAVCAVWKRLPGRRNVGWRTLGHVADMPVLRWLSAAGYAMVARNRHRLRGPA